MAKEWVVMCKRCDKEKVRYSGMMYEKMEEFGQSRPEYCEKCRKELALQKMTMGAAYFSAKMRPDADPSEVIPGELGMVYHPPRPHIEVEVPAKFDPKDFGATPDKVVELYEWFRTKGHQVAVVIGPTGSGKSTALPYWLVFPPQEVPKDFFTRDGQILITQPRIMATTSIAEYLGILFGSSVGKGFDIGYRYSKDRNADRFNAAFLATDGILINMIKGGQLGDLSVVMVDEAHERSTNIDLILRLLKDQIPFFPHLKVLIVSATINKDKFLDYFGRDVATAVEFESKRKHSSTEIYRDEEEKLDFDDPRKLRNQLVPALVEKVMWILKKQITGEFDNRGHTLAFLHGVEPIKEAVRELRKLVEGDATLRDEVEVFPLYSDLPEEEREYARVGKDKNKIRVIVCTNVAEASITVDGTVYVVDSGVENRAEWDSDKRMKKVPLRLISQANAKQRWGRAGRTADGFAYTLYTKEQFEEMEDYPVPAIQRSPMEDIILTLLEMGVEDVKEGWIDSPVTKEIERAYESLRTSGAIDADGMLTLYGALLSRFSYTPDLTNLILLSDRFECSVELATILPVIRNGGHKRLLLSDDNWSMAEKRVVNMIHKALFKGCKDDVDFILKLYSIWFNPPVLDADKNKPVSLEEKREAWANEFYVNFKMFDGKEGVETEKAKIMQLLNVKRRDQRIREIDFDLVNRVRIAVACIFPLYIHVVDKYEYKVLENNASTDATLQMCLNGDLEDVIKNYREHTVSAMALAKKMMELEIDKEAMVFSVPTSKKMLLIDSGKDWLEMAEALYPIGSEFDGVVSKVIVSGAFVRLDETQEGYLHVSNMKLTRRVDSAVGVIKVNDEVRVKIIEHDPNRQQVKLALV